MIRRPPRSTQSRSSAASDVYKRQFYNWAWQTFLFVTQPSPLNRPAFLSFETIEDVFGQDAARQFAAVTTADRQQRNILSLAPRGAKQHTQIPALNGGFKQAGDLDAILVDQN